MAWPALPDFGLVENPIIYSPFVMNNYPGSSAGSPSSFLLMDNTNFLLMDGTQLLLMGT